VTLPCDGTSPTPYTPTRVGVNAPVLGAELWAFIPQDLLPQLRWLTSPSYDHVYFVDSKPKVADVRIFCDSAGNAPPSCIDGQAVTHPGGWGTILIGGFRLGGSCSNCNLKGKPRTVTADFNYDGTTTDTGNGALGQNSDTRVFLSSYFVLDITNPEKDPVLLWVFRDSDLGFTTTVPSVLRLNPSADGRTDATNAKWYAVFGTGPTDHDGSSSQIGKFFAVDLALGPKYSKINDTTILCGLAPCITANVGITDKSTRVFSTGTAGAFMGDALTADIDLDFRVDAVYVGTSWCASAAGAITSPCGATAPTWKGAMYRLTTNNGNPDPDTWGVANAPTVLVSKFTSQGISPCLGNLCPMGPITASPQVTSDEQHNIWIFFGSGRLFGNSDKTNADRQYFVGVVDCIMSGQCTNQTLELSKLYDVSKIEVCDITLVGCAGPSQNVSINNGVSYTGSFDTLSATMNAAPSGIRTYDGWFTALPNTRERDLNRPLVLAGTLFFDTYIPTDGICEASGTGKLYGLYYLTGTAYKSSSLGAGTLNGVGVLNKSISMGDGMPSEVSVHIGALGSTDDGQVVNGTGCKSRTSVIVQKSTGAMGQTCVRGGSAGNPFSEMLTWRDL
jgi:type IV pilus assembly protein PilY1